MQPHDAIALESFTRLLIRNLASTSELEASQTKHTQGQHIPKVLNLQPRPAKGLFISPSTKRAIVSLHWTHHEDIGRSDVMAPDATQRPTPG
jgi:hypothetical protein